MIIKSLIWREYKKGRKNNSLYYMNCVEQILSEYIGYLNLREKIRLFVGSNYQVIYLNGVYNLEVPKDKINSVNLYDELNYLEVATILAHELGHIVSKDSKIFGLYDKTFVWLKRNKVLNSLIETRADIFSMNLVMNIYGGFSYKWFSDDVDYKKCGYFNSGTRLFIVQNFQEYDRNVVDYIFENIYKKDKYTTILEIKERIEKDKTITKDKQNWMLNLLCIK